MTDQQKRIKRVLIASVLVLTLLALYPAFVLCYTWTHVAHSDFEGGRHGPLDAYRHTLASAIVSYTLDECVVDWISRVMEGKGRESNLMDIHNNRIGASIGTSASSFSEIEPMVTKCILNGAENSSSLDQITWLPKETWRKSRLW